MNLINVYFISVTYAPATVTIDPERTPKFVTFFFFFFIMDLPVKVNIQYIYYTYL